MKKLTTLILLAVLFFTGQGWGAVIYVNPAAGYTDINGYGDGSDARDRTTAWGRSTARGRV